MKSRYFLLLTIFLGLLVVGAVLFVVARGVQRPQNPTPSKAAGTVSDPAKCQGNPDPSPKCFDCQKDTGTSIVNQLDFASCFKKFYGKDVGQ